MSENNIKISNEDDERNDGQECVRNKNLSNLDVDHLYHLALGTNCDLERLFGDVKFVCMGGTCQRMLSLAKYLRDEFGLNPAEELHNYSAPSQRFSMYKVGPVLTVSHGMGLSSLSILLHEITKLVHYAKCKNPVFIRVGTSGGLGINPGTIVITDKAFDGILEQSHEFTVLGKRIRRPAVFDRKLANAIKSHASATDGYDTILGGTMGTDDFYEAQGRIDGAICEHTEEQKFEFLKKAHSLGVRNIEMEAPLFGSFTHYTGIKSAIVCVTLVNRLMGDQITETKETMTQWQMRPQILVGRYIKSTLG